MIRPASEPREEPWCPRGGYIHSYETYRSPQPNHSPHHGDYRLERSSNWTPRSNSPHRHDHYHTRDHRDNNETSGGLSVPCLGGEGRSSHERFSPKLHLAPRLNRPIIWESRAPPRPPKYSPQDFRPPTPISPQYQRFDKNASYYNRSPVEEKISSDIDKIVSSQQAIKDMLNPKERRTLSSSGFKPIITKSRSSPDQEEITRKCNENGAKTEDGREPRASPGGILTIKENKVDGVVEGDDDQSDEAQAVDDIAMSPIPYDREDPVTLMDLPDDILALPISPCGPHDDPVLS